MTEEHIQRLNNELNKDCDSTSRKCVIQYVGTYEFRVALEDLHSPLVLEMKAQTDLISTNNHIELTCTDIRSSFGTMVCSSTELNESSTPSEMTDCINPQQVSPYDQNSRGTPEHDNIVSVIFKMKPSDPNWRASMKDKYHLEITNSISGLSEATLEIENPNGCNGDIVCWFDSEAKQILVYRESFFRWKDEDGDRTEGYRKHFYWYDLE